MPPATASSRKARFHAAKRALPAAWVAAAPRASAPARDAAGWAADSTTPSASGAGRAGLGAHQRLAVGVVVEILVPQRRIGTSPSAPVSSSFTKAPNRAMPLIRPVKVAPDPVGQEGREVAVGGVALGRPSTGARCRRCAWPVSSSRSISSGFSPSFAPAMRRDQRAVHDQVGIAPDGRGEMRVVRRSARPKCPKFSGCNRPASSSAACSC
jgi:hypothetical protein